MGRECRLGLPECHVPAQHKCWSSGGEFRIRRALLLSSILSQHIVTMYWLLAPEMHVCVCTWERWDAR